MDALRLLLVLGVIILGLRLKVPVGITLLAAGGSAALLYGVALADLGLAYWHLVQSERFLFLLTVVILITTLGSLLGRLGFLDRLSVACRSLPGGRRLAAGLMPPLVGLMPMPGGSLLSAPMVGQVLDDPRYSPELKTTTNYWFRHVAEFAWPVYPGLILTEAMTGLPLGSVALLQLPMTFIMIAVGILIYIRRIEPEPIAHPHPVKAGGQIVSAIWPIVLAIVIYAITGINLNWAVLVALVALIVTARPARVHLVGAVREGISWKLILMVFGVLSFQSALELTGAIESIPRLATSYDLPPELVIFMVCFTAGLLTGMVSAFIALGYTILAGFLYDPVIVPGHILLAYVSGFLGIMLSPAHLCLILTNEYFGSDLGRVYRLLIPAAVLLAICGLGLYYSGWPGLF